MTINELEILVQQGEHRQLELKKTAGELKDGMHSACAFLNSEGGWLIFGVAPTSLKIEGQTVSDNTQREFAQALSLLEPQVDVTVEYIDIPDCWQGWQCDGIVAYRGICNTAIPERERTLSVCRNPVFHCHARPYSRHRVSFR